MVIIVGKVDLFSKGKRRKERGIAKKRARQKNNYKNIKHKQHP
jgi:hypothetical protein